MLDITAIGEIVIDFTPAGFSEVGNTLYERHPGGGPANMLVAAAKNQMTGALLTKVGKDPFGTYLAGVLKKNGLESCGLRYSQNKPTITAWVDLDENKERSFFSIQTDMSLTDYSVEDIDYSLIDECGILHIAGSMMCWEKPMDAVKKAFAYAKKNHKLTSCDMNWRPVLSDREYAVREMAPFVRQFDILKLSDEEFELCTGTTDLETGSRMLLDGGVKFLAVTMGARGCYYRYANGGALVTAYEIQAVDSNGAGDAFTGYLLAGLWKQLKEGKEIGEIPPEEIGEIVDRANAAGALCTTKSGSLMAIPDADEVERFRNAHR
ncbi:carbohydrate kinase family protein [Diplocloster agilis]|uniref:Carbohydrate kinase n=1 Tax=Diplocloster agilis TaxID=2850323 RepID=A0A949JZS0_9FIRM|nr:carbohydrate kinase [Diplocloster agilis]MBU9737579.1 carbohydrate kinase [Diplocloster agilis]